MEMVTQISVHLAISWICSCNYILIVCTVLSLVRVFNYLVRNCHLLWERIKLFWQKHASGCCLLTSLSGSQNEVQMLQGSLVRSKLVHVPFSQCWHGHWWFRGCGGSRECSCLLAYLPEPRPEPGQQRCAVPHCCAPVVKPRSQFH